MLVHIPMVGLLCQQCWTSLKLMLPALVEIYVRNYSQLSLEALVLLHSFAS